MRLFRGRSLKSLALILPAAAVAAAAVVVGAALSARAVRGAPEASLEQGVQQLQAALEERAKTGPASVLPAMGRSLAQGTTEFTLTCAMGTVSGQLLTDMEESRLLFQDVTLSSPYLPGASASLYLDQDGLAVRALEVFGDDAWYGLSLDDPLCEQNSAYLYLDADETAQLQEIVDALAQCMAAAENPAGEQMAADLEEAMWRFLDSHVSSAAQETVSVDGADVEATVISYALTNGDLADLTDELFDILLQEDYLACWGKTYLELEGGGMELEELAAKLAQDERGLTASMRQGVDGKTSLDFALNGSGVLFQVTWETALAGPDVGGTASVSGRLFFGVDPAASGVTRMTYAAVDAEGGVYTSTLSAVSSDADYTVSWLAEAPDSGPVSAVLDVGWTASNAFSLSLDATDGETAVYAAAGGTLETSGQDMTLLLDRFSLVSGGRTESCDASLLLKLSGGGSIVEPDWQSLLETQAGARLFRELLRALA